MLTETEVRTTKAGTKPRKLSDERGLFLLVNPNGSKLWRLKYRFGGKEKALALGAYPDVTLKAARQKRDQARAQLAPARARTVRRVGIQARQPQRRNVVAGRSLLACHYGPPEGDTGRALDPSE